MSSATSEHSRHTFAALRSAGLIDKKKDKDKDARMVDTSPGGVKRTGKVRSGTRMDIVRESSSRSSLIAGKTRGSHSSLGIRGAAKLSLIGTSSKIPRRTTEHARRIQGGSLATSSTPSSVDLWREFIAKRWRPEAQFLDLERIAEDPILAKIHRTSKGFPDPREAAVMFKLAAQLKPEVLAISLAHNGLTNTLSLQSIARYLPNLRNLSLADNKLRLWRDFDHFSMKKSKLLHLKELVLTGNPMRDLDPSPSKMERYRAEILRRFPTLELLDSEAVTKIAFSEPGPSTLPPPTPGQGPASFPVGMNAGLIAPGIEGYVGEFLYRFFTAYDSSRASLGDVYAPEATFSFSANTGIPPRARVQGHHNSLPNQKSLEWTPYVHNGSRNLSRVHTSARAQEYLFIGPENIIKKITTLPGTRHDIAVREKFVVDAWPVPGVLPGPSETSTVLFVSVYGQFEEEPSHGIRSFDRNFILAPAQPGSNTQAAGWQVVILSDQLVIRAYSSHEAWAPGPIRMPPVESISTPPPQTQSLQPPVPTQSAMTLSQQQQQQLMGDPALTQLPEPQRSYVVELSIRTRLTVAFSIQCLEMNGWDPQRALANFEQVRTQLPREAFF